MSNVLIGIIGVILFIGLALAGALILGDDFRSSRASTKAAALSGTMQQATQASNMFKLKTGQEIYATSGTTYGAFLVPRFLKAVPKNPVDGSDVVLIDASGSQSSGQVATMWYTNIGSDARSKDICRAIEEGAGASNPDASQNQSMVSAAGGWGGWTASNKRMGCLVNSYYTPALYQAYIWF